MADCLLFVYDHWAHPKHWLRLTKGKSHQTTSAALDGYKQVWNMAKDNTLSVEGEVKYIDPRTQLKAPVAVTFLNITADKFANMTGFLLPLTEQQLRDVDKAQRYYERIDVALNVTPDEPDMLPANWQDMPIWVYRGRLSAQQTFSQFYDSGMAVLDENYYAALLEAYQVHGEAYKNIFLKECPKPHLPTLALQAEKPSTGVQTAIWLDA